MNRTFLKLHKFSTAACLTLIFASFAWSQKHDIDTSQQQDGDVKITAALLHEGVRRRCRPWYTGMILQTNTLD